MGDVRLDWGNYIEFAADSDIGMRRSNNQDSHAAVLATSDSQWRRRGHFFIVADGMGAHAAGELASKMAVDGVPHRYHKSPEPSAPEAILHAILETNAEIFRRGHENNEFLHMGTTASMLVLLPQGALIAHVGDSRIYRLRETQLEQLTFDHSLVWELRAAGQLRDNSDLAHAVPKNVITRSLGPNANVQIDLEGPLDLAAGDVFLICSDGLTGRLEDDELAAVLANYSPREAARLLIEMANLRGGQDNITVVVVKVVGTIDAKNEAAVEPITIGRKKPGSALVHTIGVAAAVFGLLALVFSITESWLLAATSIIGGIASVMWLSWYRSHLHSGTASLTAEHKLGRAPYTSTECPTRNRFIQSLPDLVQEFRQSAEEAKWVSSWPSLSLERLAQVSRLDRNEDTLAAYSEVVCNLMQEVRKQQKRKAGDSSIVL